MISDHLDDLLDGALVATAGDQEDIDASRHRIERRLADAVWQEALSMSYTQRCVAATLPATSRTSPPTAPVHDQAVHDLRELCTLVIRGSRAARTIAGLVNSARIEPDGALTFACLLHLTGHEDGAQFWWQFSAGAGKSTSALCLHLLHLQRGEMREAEHWAREATSLDAVRQPAQPTRLFYARTGPHRALYRCGHTTVESMLLRALNALGDPAPLTGSWASALSAAVRRLRVVPDLDYGQIPRPDPTLASSLELCFTPST